MIASNNQSQQNKSINFDQTIGSCSNFAFRFYKPDLRGGHLTITKWGLKGLQIKPGRWCFNIYKGLKDDVQIHSL
jgi:hypothetical protein